MRIHPPWPPLRKEGRATARPRRLSAPPLTQGGGGGFRRVLDQLVKRSRKAELADPLAATVREPFGQAEGLEERIADFGVGDLSRAEAPRQSLELFRRSRGGRDGIQELLGRQETGQDMGKILLIRGV